MPNSQFIPVQVVKNEMSQSNLSERQLKIHLEDLTRRLDPKKDDGYVDKTTFVEQAVEWMHSVMVRMYILDRPSILRNIDLGSLRAI